MKKKFLRFISLILVLSLLTSCFAISGFATDDETPIRITCTMNGDSQTQRGFTWYTKSNTDSLLEINCETAEITYDDVFEWEGYYCHKALAKGLKAGTSYEYTVGSKNVRSNVGTFITDNADSNVKFIAVADV